MKAQDDIRVFTIECTVIPVGSQAEIEFQAPVREAIHQEIPIVNDSSHDWPMEAEIHGAQFFGPEKIIAKAFATTNYTLTYRPQYEGSTIVSPSSRPCSSCSQ